MLKSSSPLSFPSSGYQSTYTWLMSQRIISCPIDEIPQKSIDGTLICSLIHKLEGRTCTLGFHRSPKTFSACRANLKKALEYLRKFSKFRSQFLWSYEEILRGDPETVWGLLTDIKGFYPCGGKGTGLNVVRPSSVQPRGVGYSQGSPDKRMGLTGLETQYVKSWLEELGLAYLIHPNLHYLKDPVRNGVLLAKVLNQVRTKFEFFSHPQNIEEVRENINSVVFAVKKEIKGYTAEELMDEHNVWALLGKIMEVYKTKDQIVLPYSPSEIKNLQHSVFKWVFSLKPFDQFYPENFLMLCKSLKTGVILTKIIEKVLKVQLECTKYPNSLEDSLKNIEIALKPLQSNEKMSKGYIWEPYQIYKPNPLYILALLEDLHRLAANLPPRPIGEDYHSDGPFYGKQLNFSITHSEKSVWNPSSVYLSPDKSMQVKSILNSRSGSPIVYKTVSNFRNSCETSMDNISPKQKKVRKIQLDGFEWIHKIGIKPPQGLDLTDQKIPSFRSGEFLCQVLQVLETRNFRGVMKTVKGTAAAAKNMNIAFEVLRSKPAFGLPYIEAKVLAGDGEHIRMLLKEIYKVYKNTIIALMKFNGNY